MNIISSNFSELDIDSQIAIVSYSITKNYNSDELIEILKKKLVSSHVSRNGAYKFVHLYQFKEFTNKVQLLPGKVIKKVLKTIFMTDVKEL